MTDEEAIFNLNKSMAIAESAVSFNRAVINIINTKQGAEREAAIKAIESVSRHERYAISQQTFSSKENK